MQVARTPVSAGRALGSHAR